MKIAIDASFLGPSYGGQTKTGLGHYIYHLVKAMETVTPNNTYLMLYNERQRTRNFSSSRIVEKAVGIPQSLIRRRVSLSFGFRSALWYRMVLPFNLLRWGADVYFGPVGIAPTKRPCKAVITVHDITSILFREQNLPDHQRFWETWLSRSVRAADAVLTNSEATKRDLVERLAIPSERIRAIHLGVHEQFHQAKFSLDSQAQQRVKHRYHLPNHFVLCVATLSPRKNVAGLVKAFSLIKKGKQPDLRLVIVGNKGWLCDDILQTVRSLGLENEVLFTGYVEDQDLPYIYAGAAVFAFPSFYEGFGFPVLEAMACGVPVVTSNVSSLPEVAGDAALLVDPHQPEQIAKAISQLLVDEKLRRDLVEKGLRHARQFTWERTARETLRVFEEVTA